MLHLHCLFRRSHSSRQLKHLICYLKRLKNSYTTRIPSLTSCSQLARYIQDPAWHQHYRILDATWDLDDGDYRSNHFTNRIPGSKFFSFEECRDKCSDFPRMLPSPVEFETYVSDLGISNDHHVIVYDNHEVHGLYSSPRVWWMFRTFGHDNVSVLDGGFKKWLQDGLPFVTGEYSKDEVLPRPTNHFTATFRPSFVKHFEDMAKNVELNGLVQVADARGEQRFLGQDKEGKLDKLSGHIPCSSSTPFGGLLDNTRSVRSKDEIKEYFSSNGIDLNKDVIATCGSGITASVLSFAIHYATNKDVPVYDGSWTEWKVRASEEMISRGNEK